VTRTFHMYIWVWFFREFRWFSHLILILVCCRSCRRWASITIGPKRNANNGSSKRERERERRKEKNDFILIWTLTGVVQILALED
jgi:hypothetical protein